MVFENLVKQILKEQSNPVLPVNLPSPEERVQKQQTFQQQQQKSVQDIKNLALGTLDVAKFIDPTGILSWGDALEAYKQFTKLPSPLNGLILGIALCSIIPVGKYYASPAKAALKAGKIAEASKLLKTALPKLEQNLATVATKGMDTKVVQQALNAGEQNIEGSLQKLITTDAKTAAVGAARLSALQLAEQFNKEFLSKFQINQAGTHNCAWATEQFIKWAKEKGIDAKAIYFVWPGEKKVTELKKAGILSPKYATEGESHIAPVVNGTIIDFTYKQFDNSFNDIAKITNVKDWKNVYSKYGYGANSVMVGGRPQSVMIDDFDKLKNMKEIDGITTIYPSKLKITQASLSEFQDFAQEFKWYQDKGLFKKDIDMQKIFEGGKVMLAKPGSLDEVSNSYTKLINGKNENERFKQFVDLYLKEERGEMTRAETAEEKINYLKSLVRAVKTNKNINPPIVLNVPGAGQAIIGGRTRAAAAKVAGVPINVKYIEMGENSIENINKIKQTFNEIKV